MGLFDKLFGKKQQQESLEQGLQKTREGFLSKITKAIAGKSTVDEEVLERISSRLRDTFSLRIPVRPSPPGSLPRFDFKARRWRKV